MTTKMSSIQSFKAIESIVDWCIEEEPKYKRFIRLNATIYSDTDDLHVSLMLSNQEVFQYVQLSVLEHVEYALDALRRWEKDVFVKIDNL